MRSLLPPTFTVVATLACHAIIAPYASAVPSATEDRRPDWLVDVGRPLDSHPTRLIVRSKPGASQRDIDEAFTRAGVFRTTRVLGGVPGLRIVESDAGGAARAAAALAADPNILYVERDWIIPHATSARTPNDPSFQWQWGMNNTGQDLTQQVGAPYVCLPGYDINAPEAWDHWTGSTAVRIAVIDTGVFYTHPDLGANVWVNTGEIPNNHIDDDHNGYVDDVRGYDFVDNDGNPIPDTTTGVSPHGTHCAGIIGAVGNNSRGVAGVNWRASIVALRVIDENNNLPMSAALGAFQYCLDNNIKLSSNSWGWLGTPPSQALFDMLGAMNGAGHLAVFAAGNSCWNNEEPGPRRATPACYELPNVLSVSMAGGEGGTFWWTNVAPHSGDLVAPGHNVLSTVANGQYAYYSGTSMAAPHVAGTAALIWSRFPGLSMAQVRNVLLLTARPEESLVGVCRTHAMVDAGTAMAYLMADRNGNGQPDGADVSGGGSADIDANGIPDEVQTEDNNANGVPDIVEFGSGLIGDCDGNGRIDTLERDCNANGIADMCEMLSGEIADDNDNGIPDTCDIEDGRSLDLNGNGVVDEIEPDFNANGVPDDLDIASGASADCNHNGVPDEADLHGAPLVRQVVTTRGVFIRNHPLCAQVQNPVIDVWDDFTVERTVTLTGGTSQVLMWWNGPDSPSGLAFNARIADAPAGNVLAVGSGQLAADLHTVAFTFPGAPSAVTLAPGTYWICVQINDYCGSGDFGMWLNANVGQPNGSECYVHTPTNWLGYGTAPVPASTVMGNRPADVAFTLTYDNDVDNDGVPDDCVGTPACPADWNGDGVVNSTDVSDFINAWFEDQSSGTLVADWDHNGVVNSTDVSDFINAWFEDTASGCGG